MSTPSAPTQRPRPSASSMAAFVVSTLTLAIVGCVIIGAGTPWIKTAILDRRLDDMQAQVRDGRDVDQAIIALQHLQPLLERYPVQAVTGYRLLAKAHAANRQHEDATDVAADLYRLISGRHPGTEPQTGPAAWADQLYNRLTDAQPPGDRWQGYRVLAQQYRTQDDHQGLQHMREHLDRKHDEHPWLDVKVPDEKPPVTPDNAQVDHPDPDPEPETVHGPQWALPLPDGAVAYNVRREELRTVPPDTLIDVHEHIVWNGEPMVRSSVHVMNRWVSNIFLRTSQIAIQDGNASDVEDREKRLHMERLQLLEQIETETQVPPQQPQNQPPDDTAATPTAGNARRRLRELEQEHARLHEEMEQAEGARRMELIDELRRLGMKRYRLQQAAAGNIETLNMQEESTAPEKPPESPRLQRLQRQLANLKQELQRLTDSEE